MSVPNGIPSVTWIEWGVLGNYDRASSPIGVGEGLGVVRVSVVVGGLTNRGTYQCRLVSSNAAGVARGASHFFTTGRNVTAWGTNNYGQITLPAGLSNVVAVAGGSEHGMALRNNGTVRVWGAYLDGQTNVPANLSNVVAVAAGGKHCLVVRTNGRVVAWGSNSYGQTNAPVSATNVIAVAAGLYHSLALRSNGTVVAWGWNNYGQINVPAGLSNVVAVVGGGYYSLALKVDGTMVGWGSNSSGQAGQVPGLTNIAQLAAGLSHTVALRSDGSVVAWGLNNLGQTNMPAGLTNIVAIAAGGQHSLALTADGAVIGWGNDSGGQASVPAALSNAVAIAAGGAFSLAIGNLPPQALPQLAAGPANHDLVIWLTGSDPNQDLLRFRIVSLPTGGALYQYSGGVRGMAITTPETMVSDAVGRLVFAPATNTFGEAYDAFDFGATDGDADSPPARVTIQIVGVPGAVTCPPTEAHADSAGCSGIAVLNGLPGVAWFQWATNDSFNRSTVPIPVNGSDILVRVTGLISEVEVGAPYRYRLVTSNAAGVTLGNEQLAGVGGRVEGWGSASSGQLSMPEGLSNVVAVATGSSHSLALRGDGRVFAWGANGSGQTNVPANLSNVIAIAAGASHNLALRSNGTVVAWGTTNFGLNTVPAGLGNVVAIAAGYSHSLALKGDGKIVAWGANDYGQTNVPANLGIAIAVGGGRYHSLAVLSDGRAVAWGWDKYLQSTVPPGLTNAVAVTGGFGHSLALRRDGSVMAWARNTYGQTNVPATVVGGICVSSGGENSLALLHDGKVVVWGLNSSGEGTVPVSLKPAIAAATSGAHTLAVVVGPDLPLAQTAAPKWNSASAATLRGYVTPNGTATTAWFEWGTNGSFGPLSSATGVGSGTNALLIGTEVVGLAPNRPYVYRLVASNQWGVVKGPWQLLSVGRKLAALVSVDAPQFNIPLGASNIVALAGGFSHGLALDCEGRTLAWGDNSLGQTDLPVGLSNAVALAAGEWHSLLVRADGSVNAFGNNYWGASTVPPELTNSVAISAGRAHSLSVRGGGAVLAWGNGIWGATNVPPGLTDATAVAGGWGQSLALRRNGRLVYWGYDAWGSANTAASLTDVVAIASGYSHCLALRSNGTVTAWGRNNAGQINVPEGLSNVVAVAGGSYHSLALRSDGSIVAWGDTSSAQYPLSDLTQIAAADGGDGWTVVAGPNMAPWTQSQTNHGCANTDMIVQLSGWDFNHDPLTFRITSLPTAGSLYQFTSSGRGLPISAPSTIVGDSLGRVIFAPATGGVGLPYSTFGFSANDGETDSTPETITQNILPKPVLEVAANSGNDSGAFSVSLSFSGLTNASYRVLASTDLTTWITIGAADQPEPGRFLFSDNASTNWPSRFYRVTTP